MIPSQKELKTGHGDGRDQENEVNPKEEKGEEEEQSTPWLLMWFDNDIHLLKHKTQHCHPQLVRWVCRFTSDVENVFLSVLKTETSKERQLKFDTTRKTLTGVTFWGVDVIASHSYDRFWGK